MSKAQLDEYVTDQVKRLLCEEIVRINNTNKK